MYHTILWEIWYRMKFLGELNRVEEQEERWVAGWLSGWVNIWKKNWRWTLTSILVFLRKINRDCTKWETWAFVGLTVTCLRMRATDMRASQRALFFPLFSLLVRWPTNIMQVSKIKTRGVMPHLFRELAIPIWLILRMKSSLGRVSYHPLIWVLQQEALRS